MQLCHGQARRPGWPRCPIPAGCYASRPPGELHGPFKTDVGCVVLDLSFPGRIE